MIVSPLEESPTLRRCMRSAFHRHIHPVLTVEQAAMLAAKLSGAFLWYARKAPAADYSDVGMTTPAVDGGPVAAIGDILGTTTHYASQSTGTAQPTLTVDGKGLRSLALTSAQYLLSDYTPNGGALVILATLSMTALTTRSLIGCKSSAGDRLFINHNTANTLTLASGTNAALVTGAVTDGAPAVVSANVVEGGNSSMWVNGVLAGTAATPGTVQPACPVAIGALNTAGSSAFIAGEPVSLVCIAPPGTSNAARLAIERLAAQLVGVTYPA